MATGIKPINIIYFAIAMILPIVYYTVLTPNTNEGNPWVFLTVPLLFAAAAYVSVAKGTERIKWVLWSTLVGAVEAAILYFA